MVKEGTILGHTVSGSGIEVDKAKIEAISKLPYPTNVKAIQRFLGHADLGKLTKAEIRDLFPEERLMAISDKNNEPCITFGMSPSYSNSVLTKSYEGAWPEMRRHKFFDNVTADHLEDSMASPPPQEKYLRPGFTGHISSKMHVSWYKFAMHVNEQETSHQGMKHLRNTSKSVKYSMFRGLTLWDLSPHETETNASW
ncbi:hypothetical protein Tco_1004626 [Tanacetum coccineum]|uniref:Uncharacterized protein n=1 Tax=Tanacetum coccineum TaxID=301880 RepID=A0ABQ5FD50_9ASTR